MNNLNFLKYEVSKNQYIDIYVGMCLDEYRNRCGRLDTTQVTLVISWDGIGWGLEEIILLFFYLLFRFYNEHILLQTIMIVKNKIDIYS